jgi:membrane protein DedA with SNARE-associated domain
MNSDKSDNWGVIALFPFVYFGLLASYSFFHTFALGEYERKDGQWGSLQIELLIGGVATFMAFMGYLIGVSLVKTGVQRLSRPKFALITAASAFLSVAVLFLIGLIESYTWSVSIDLGVRGASLFLPPALICVSLVKMGQVCSAGHQPIQR